MLAVTYAIGYDFAESLQTFVSGNRNQSPYFSVISNFLRPNLEICDGSVISNYRTS